MGLTNIDLADDHELLDDCSESAVSNSLRVTTLTEARSLRVDDTSRRKANKVLDLLGISGKSHNALLKNDCFDQMVAMTDSDDSELCMDEGNMFEDKKINENIKSSSYDLHKISSDAVKRRHVIVRTLSDVDANKKNFDLMHLMVEQGMCTSRSFNSVMQISQYQS